MFNNKSMNKFLLIILVISYGSVLSAQNFSHEYGKISKKELELKQYDKDSSADAVVIYDIGMSYFIPTSDNDFDLFFEHRAKIKIFNKAGLRWAENQIYYYTNKFQYEEIVELKGNTYNLENGEIKTTAFDPKNAYDEKFDEHRFVRKFAMPDVKEGSVFEFTYKIRTPYNVNFREWYFQQKIPVIYSEYTTKMIPFYEYVAVLQGARKYDDYKTYVDEKNVHHSFVNYNDNVFTFIMKDLPAFKDESFITSSDDYLIRLNFQLAAIHDEYGHDKEYMSTWPKLAEKLLDEESFGDYMNDCKRKSKKIVDTMQFPSATNLDKAKTIDHFVKSNYNWNGNYAKFTNKNANEFLTSKTGNCSEINLFLAGMLQSTNIEAYPVLISTRDNGKVNTNYPFLHYFNYVVVLAKIDSTMFLLDATEPLCNFNELPARCLNEYGFIIQKKKGDFLTFQSNLKSNINYDFNVELNPINDSIYTNYKLSSTGYDALDYRKSHLDNNDKLKAKLLSENVTSPDSIFFANEDQIDKPFEIRFNEKTQLESIEDKIIISPFCNRAITENPLKMPERNYPVDMVYKKARTFQSTIIKPTGYKLFSIPENILINNDMVKIMIKSDTTNVDTVQIQGIYEFKKDIYSISEYKDLKTFYDIIVSKFNEKLVFVKNK